MQYVQPPGAGNASGFIDILHATLRGAGCRWNGPIGVGANLDLVPAKPTADSYSGRDSSWPFP